MQCQQDFVYRAFGLPTSPESKNTVVCGSLTHGLLCRRDQRLAMRQVLTMTQMLRRSLDGRPQT